MSKEIGSLLLLLLLAAPLAAADVSMEATVDRSTVPADGMVTVSIIITTGLTSSLPEPAFEGLEDFDITGRSSSSSSSISFVNGTFASEKTITYRYAMTPLKTGELVIPAAVLEVEGEKYRTNKINIRVTGDEPTSGTAGSPNHPDKTRASGDRDREDIFILGTITKDTCYTEEAVVLEYTLYSRTTIFDVSIVDTPESGGFWWEEDQTFSRGSGRREIVSGHAYTVYPLKRFVLYPLQPGAKTIEPLALGCRVRVRSGDLFDSFSIFGRERTITITSNRVDLTVLPVPPEGRPEDYHGAVGDFTLRAKLGEETVGMNEPLTLHVTIEGEGNFTTMGPPVVSVPISVSFYDPDEKVDVHFAGESMQGKKTYDYILLPRETGSFAVSDISFSFFDPEKHAYVRRSAGPLPFTVEQSRSTAQQGSPATAEAIQLGEDIRYIKEISDNLARHSRRKTLLSWAIAINVSSLILFGAFLVRRKRTEKIFSNRALRRHRLSGRSLKRSLRESGDHLERGDSSRLAQSCEHAIVEFIGNRLDRETKGMTIRELISLLRGQSVEEETVQEFTSWHELCQRARFSPDRMDDEDDRELYERTGELARKLGEELP